MEDLAKSNVTSSSKSSRLLGRFAPCLAVVVILLLLAVLVAVGVLPRLLSSAQNIADLLRQTSVVACAAMGLFIVMRHGLIDLSVGSVVVLSSVVTAATLTTESDRATVVIEHGAQDAVTLMTDLYPLGWPILALVLGGLCGLTCGLINGVLISGLRLNAFVVTLATALIYGAAALPLANNRVVYPPHTWFNDLFVEPTFDAAGWFLPTWLWAVGGVAAAGLRVVIALRPKAPARWKVASHIAATILVVAGSVQLWRLGLRQPAVCLLVAAIVVAGMAGVLQWTGHTSGGPRGTRWVNVERRAWPTVRAFTVAGLLWGVAGLLAFSIEGGANPHVEPEATVWFIAAAMAGGASLYKRRDSIVGVVCGAIALSLVVNATTHAFNSPWAASVSIGVALVGLLMLDRATAGRRSVRGATDVPESSPPRPE